MLAALRAMSAAQLVGPTIQSWELQGALRDMYEERNFVYP